MGTFDVNIRVGPARGGEMAEVSAMVDTGASDTVLPASLLEGLQVRPVSKVGYTLANGQVEEYDVGEARIAYNGSERVCPVVFGEEGVYLLGATALQILMLVADPVNEELAPAPPRRARPF